MAERNIHGVSKNVHFLFLNNFVKKLTDFNYFWYVKS